MYVSIERCSRSEQNDVDSLVFVVCMACGSLNSVKYLFLKLCTVGSAVS